MRTRIRIARLVAASALVLGTGLSAGAGPASASYSSWAGSIPDSVTFAADDDATPDSSHHGIHDAGGGDTDQSPNGQISAI